ncbi:hypothetical protein [Halosegnis sp.]|uniref:hypothetical protein n=1 Tax=Halosegnis sp. TaxID=2864959 RepID=UPI0035D40C9E
MNSEEGSELLDRAWKNFIGRVERAYEEQPEADGADGSQASFAGERALASIERVTDEQQGRVDQSEEREDAHRERF